MEHHTFFELKTCQQFVEKKKEKNRKIGKLKTNKTKKNIAPNKHKTRYKKTQKI